MMMMVLIERDRLVPSQRAEADFRIDHFPVRAFPTRNQPQIPSVNTAALQSIYPPTRPALMHRDGGPRESGEFPFSRDGAIEIDW